MRLKRKRHTSSRTTPPFGKGPCPALGLTLALTPAQSLAQFLIPGPVPVLPLLPMRTPRPSPSIRLRRISGPGSRSKTRGLDPQRSRIGNPPSHPVPRETARLGAMGQSALTEALTEEDCHEDLCRHALRSRSTLGPFGSCL